jgi:hypothetical protein
MGNPEIALTSWGRASNPTHVPSEPTSPPNFTEAHTLSRRPRCAAVRLCSILLLCVMGIPESESVESGAKDDNLPNPSFDSS